jgi:hypothetical protein
MYSERFGLIKKWPRLSTLIFMKMEEEQEIK